MPRPPHSALKTLDAVRQTGYIHLFLTGIKNALSGIVIMAKLELTRQEIWTILCWAGDEGDRDKMPQFYTQEEASALRKLRTSYREEKAKLRAKIEAVRERNEADEENTSDPF